VSVAQGLGCPRVISTIGIHNNGLRTSSRDGLIPGSIHHA
jgi:hypothetical protein